MRVFTTSRFLRAGLLPAAAYIFLLAGMTTPPAGQMLELCANGIDDDGDGLIDLNDPDCACAVLEPVSLIPNPSFEDLNCCPNNRSQLGCAEVWIQASEPTTDLIHNCGWGGWEEYPPPLPFPDGDGILGFRDGRQSMQEQDENRPNWKEYAGACLLSPLQAGNRYRFEFEVGFVDPLYSPPINITFFGTADCQYLPFGVGNERLGCPTNGPNWVRLGSAYVSGGSGRQWVKSIIDVTPDLDIAAIAIGPDCPGVPASVGLYYFFDNLLLDDFEAFSFRITETNHPCSEDYSLSVPDRENTAFQWYKNGIALVGETAPQLSRIRGDGRYEAVITDAAGCRVSPAFNYSRPVIYAPANVVICQEDYYPFGGLRLETSGMYVDTFRSVDNCDSIVNLNLTVLGALSDTVSAKVFAGEAYEIGGYEIRKEGDFTVNLASSLGCDSMVLVHLDYYDVYFPTAFSPNGDGINDRFTVFGNEDLAEVLELRIFDRWGNQLSNAQEWDGTLQNEPLNPGVFAYVARLRMSDGKERQFTGTVALLR